MAVASDNMRPQFTDEKIVEFVREHEDPVVTATELAEYFDVTRQAVNYRLDKLDDDSALESKQIGASAIGYYVR